MTAKKPSGQKMRSSANSPDGEDLVAVFDAIEQEFGAVPALLFYRSFSSALCVVVEANYVDVHGKTCIARGWRAYNKDSASILALAQQAAHEVYHELDRLDLRLVVSGTALSSGEDRA